MRVTDYGTARTWLERARATEPHDPEEMVRMAPFTKEIPYDWDLKNG